MLPNYPKISRSPPRNIKTISKETVKKSGVCWHPRKLKETHGSSENLYGNMLL
jgi:hypothetical protein